MVISFLVPRQILSRMASSTGDTGDVFLATTSRTCTLRLAIGPRSSSALRMAFNVWNPEPVEEVSCSFLDGLEERMKHSNHDCGFTTNIDYKWARGFNPSLIHSVHYICNPDLRRAVGQFLEYETENNVEVREYLLQNSAVAVIEKVGSSK